jgi:hypothetical protein
MTPATKPAWEPIETYQAFPTYATQEAALAAGIPGAKTYTATDDEKNWIDPKANEPGPGKRIATYKGAPWVLYLDGTFSGKLIDADQNGIVEDLAMPVAEALKLNIKPSGPGMTNVPGTGNVVPVPLNGALAPTQKIRRETPMGAWKVRNFDVLLPAEESQKTLQLQLGGLANAVAALAVQVAKIAAKLGV